MHIVRGITTYPSPSDAGARWTRASTDRFVYWGMVILRGMVIALVLLFCGTAGAPVARAAVAAAGGSATATVSRADGAQAAAQVLPESWHGIAVALDAARSHAGAGAGASAARVPAPRLLFGRTVRARLLPSTLDALAIRAEREIRLSRE